VHILDGQKHPKVWWSQSNREVLNALKDAQINLGMKAAVNAMLVKVQAQSLSFQVPATDLLSSEAYFLIKSMAK
jgi:hypothetical protein